jgi:hydrogenase maturation protein HypF
LSDPGPAPQAGATTVVQLPAAGSSVAAIGGDLKCAPCVARGREAIIGPDVGDLERPDALDQVPPLLDRMARQLDAEPELLVHDLHPDYHGTRLAHRLARQRGMPTLAVQHHHAHALACMVDAGHAGPALALTLDGTGYGIDGTTWGGEILAVHGLECRRVGHLTPLAMPGGDRVAREPWRMALSAVHHAFEGAPQPDLSPWQAAGDRRAEATWSLLRLPLPRTSSAGRLCDAVASLLDVRHEVTSEGQAAIELEAQAERGRGGRALQAFDLVGGTALGLDPAPMLRDLVDRMRAGEPAPDLALAFHRALAGALFLAAVAARDRTGLAVVALTGGTFANRVLLTDLTTQLQNAGFEVLRHQRLPPGDGALAVGQAWAGILHLQS